MTLMLASVTGSTEAEIAIAGGADLIDLKDPSQGAFGALPSAVVKEAVAIVAGRRPVSAVAGDVPMQPAKLFEAASLMAETGVDYVKIGFWPSDSLEACIEALAPLAAKVHLVAAFFADQAPLDLPALALLARHGFKAAMLDTAEKGAGRLMTHQGIADLSRFVEACRQASLLSGLAGALETPDIARLLLLQPGFLGFRSALCQSGKRTAGLDPDAVKIVRDLIPREAAGGEFGAGPKIDWRLLAARGYAAPAEKTGETDRVFVHDLTMPVAIGAYDFERGHTQRVRFNIDADVRRVSTQAEDMRDVFSYDLIVDAIKLILSRGHVALVETLAEQIATALLAHSAVAAIKVRVEKLDVLDGCVGIEIQRERAAAAARVHQIFPGLSDLSGAKTGG
jgi:(5-formylfuran-3-yl)methyl phosphate synthase